MKLQALVEAFRRADVERIVVGVEALKDLADYPEVWISARGCCREELCAVGQNRRDGSVHVSLTVKVYAARAYVSHRDHSVRRDLSLYVQIVLHDVGRASLKLEDLCRRVAPDKAG